MNGENSVGEIFLSEYNDNLVEQLEDCAIPLELEEVSHFKTENDIIQNCSGKHVEIKEPVTVTHAVPDGGWGWMVVLSSFIIHCIADGITYSFGVFTPYFIETYDISRETVGWLSSVMVGLTYCAGPFASYLIDRFGFRAVTIAGAIMSGLGFGGIYWHSELWFVFTTAAVLAGSGFGLMYLPAIISINVYFEKKMSLALGLAVCGSGFGTFALCPLIEYLVTEYSLSGSMLICGGIILNCIPCGMVLVPPNKAPIKSKPESSHISNNSIHNESCSVKRSSIKKENNRSLPQNAQNGHSYQNWDKCKQEELIKKYVLETEPNIKTVPSNGVAVNYKRRRSTSMTPKHEIEITLSECDKPGNESNGTTNVNCNTVLNEECVIKSLPDIRSHMVAHTFSPPLKRSTSRTPSIGMSHPFLFYSSMSVMSSSSNHLKSTTSSTESLKKLQSSHGKRKFGRKRGFVDDLMEIFDFSLLWDPIFLMLAVSNFLTSLGFIAPYLYMKDRAVMQGIESYKASMLISVIGVGNTAGRIIFGALSLMPCVNTLHLYNTSLLLCGLFTMLSAFLKTYELMVFYSSVYGIFTGVYVTLTSVVLADMLGKEKLNHSFGLILLFQGIATFGGPPLVGYVFDITKNYDTAFYLCGFIVGLSGLILYPLPCLQKCLNKRKSKTPK